MTQRLNAPTPLVSNPVDEQVQPAAGRKSPLLRIPISRPSIRSGAATFSSLRHRDFRLLWVGTIFMSAGQWIQQVTLGWLVYDMTGSAILLGVLNGVRTLPFLITGPAAGVAADRMDRRRLMQSTQVVLLITAFAMGSLVVTGQAEVWHLFVFTMITGVAWSFNQPVRQALVPSLVPKHDLMNAVALNAMGFNLTKMIAPTVAGLLIAWFGGGGNFFVQGATYVGVFAMIYLMEIRPAPVSTHRSALGDLKEGLKYVATNRLILGLVLAGLVARVFAMPYQTLMPIFQKDILGVGPEGLGLLMAAPGIGAVLATLALASLGSRMHHRGLVLSAALVLVGIFLITFSQTDSLALAMLALAGVGGFQMLFLNLSMMLLQIVVPDELRGRVLSIYMLDNGLMPAGALLAGITSSIVGAPSTVAAMGAIVILLAVIVIWSVPQIREAEV